MVKLKTRLGMEVGEVFVHKQEGEQQILGLMKELLLLNGAMLHL